MELSRFAPVLVVCAAMAPAQVSEGDRAPTFSIQAALNGGPKNYKALRGKVLMLDFFATW